MYAEQDYDELTDKNVCRASSFKITIFYVNALMNSSDVQSVDCLIQSRRSNERVNFNAAVSASAGSLGDPTRMTVLNQHVLMVVSQLWSLLEIFSS